MIQESQILFLPVEIKYFYKLLAHDVSFKMYFAYRILLWALKKSMKNKSKAKFYNQSEPLFPQ